MFSREAINNPIDIWLHLKSKKIKIMVPLMLRNCYFYVYDNYGIKLITGRHIRFRVGTYYIWY